MLKMVAMSAAQFDTLTYAKLLREAGFTERQAEAQAEALRAVVDENLATKRDLAELEHRFELRFKEIEARIKELDLRIEMVRKDIVIKLGSLLIGSVTVLVALFGVVIALIQLK